MTIEAGKTYIFSKSGNEVRAIAPDLPHHGPEAWEVERTQGVSAGNRMIVLARTLVPHTDAQESPESL